jgi:hypothetical protein
MLSFGLPKFTLRHCRDVKMRDKTWELWSPNSERVAFYPGIMDPQFPKRVVEDRSYHRFDGSLGRFDFTVVPQHFLSNRPWLPFVHRTPMGSGDEIDFESVFDNWEPKRLFRGLGFVKEDYMTRLRQRCTELDSQADRRSSIKDFSHKLWENRPRNTSEIIKSLKGELSFDDAVNHTARITRKLREMVAWIEFVDTLKKYQDYDVKALRGMKTEVQPADEKYMGVWLNGADEFRGLWLLLIGKVPCFIIHEYAQGRDYPTSWIPDPIDRRRAKYCTSFYEGTDIEDLMKVENNKFEVLANETGALRGNPIGKSGTNTINHPNDVHLQQSSSWAQLEYIQSGPETRPEPPKQPYYAPPPPSQPRSYFQPKPKPNYHAPHHPMSDYHYHPLLTPPGQRYRTISTTRQSPDQHSHIPTGVSHSKSHHPRSTQSESRPASSNPPLTHPTHKNSSPSSGSARPRYAPLSAQASSSRPSTKPSNEEEPLDEVIVDKERIAWIRPPPIAVASAGKWTHWHSDVREEDGVPRFIQHGKADVDASQTWFDRINRRILYLNDPLEYPPGLVSDIQSFGAPAPRWKYFQEKNRELVPVKSSHWIYKYRDPIKSEKGRQAPPPQLDQLALKTDAKPVSFYVSPMDEDYSEDEDTYPVTAKVPASPPLSGELKSESTSKGIGEIGITTGHSAVTSHDDGGVGQVERGDDVVMGNNKVEQEQGEIQDERKGKNRLWYIEHDDLQRFTKPIFQSLTTLLYGHRKNHTYRLVCHSGGSA